MYSETGIEQEDDVLLKREGIKKLMFSVSIQLVKIKAFLGGFMRKFGILSLMLIALAVISLLTCVAAWAADTAAPGTTDIASSISQYVQNNTNAESTLGVVFGGGAPQLGIGVFVGIYNSPSGLWAAGVKYTGVITGASQENLLGLGAKVKLLKLLKGTTPPPLGIIDPSFYVCGENDLGMIFKRWRAEAGVSIINLKFKSVLGL